MTDKDAERYRYAQIQTLFDLFAQATGRQAYSIQELNDWTASPEGKKLIERHHDETGKIKPTYR